MAWIYLLLAGLCEMAWIVTLKIHGGFTKLVPSLVAAFFIFLAPFFMSFAMKTLGMAASYVVWVGINSVLLVLMSIFYFGENFSILKLACIALIVVGAIGLKLLESGVIKA